MAAIAHAFTAQNTAQTTDAGFPYVDVSGASIASGNFTAGKKYLLYVTAQCSANLGNAICGVKLLHGTTDFPESEVTLTPDSNEERIVYSFFTVWVAIIAEGIKLQFKGSAGAIAKIDQIAMLAMNLSDDLTENTDWFFAELATDTSLTTAFQDGASVTWTPTTANHDWLVLSFSRVKPGNTLRSISRINESRGATLFPESRLDVNDIGSDAVFGLARVFALAATSGTVKEQAASIGANPSISRTHSSIFVLNLNKFRNHSNAYTEADLSLSATNYATQLQTISLTPDVAGDVWIGAYWGFDRNNTAREGEFRVQVDNVDQPTGQTTDNYQFDPGTATGDEGPMVLTTLQNLAASAHSIDLDASADATTGTPAGQHRTLWAVTMELPAAPAGAVPLRMLMGIGV